MLSGLVGAAIAPRIRKVTSEENLLTSVLILTFLAAIAALAIGGVAGAAVLSSAVGIAGSAGKLSFDSILQRDAPDANRGRSFAKFETRFQVTWVIGAFIPVALRMPAYVGFIIVHGGRRQRRGSPTSSAGSPSRTARGKVTAATTAAVEIERSSPRCLGRGEGSHRGRRPGGDATHPP